MTAKLQLQELVAKQQQKAKSPYVLEFKELNTEKITERIIVSLSKLASGAIPLTSICGSVGAAIYSGIPVEDYVTDDVIGQRNIKTGHLIIKELLNKRVILQYRDVDEDGERAKYMIMVNDEVTQEKRTIVNKTTGQVSYIFVEVRENAFFDELLFEMTPRYTDYWKMPVRGSVVPREAFWQPDGGVAVTGVPRCFQNIYTEESMEYVYKTINKLQKIRLKVDKDVYNVLNSIDPSILLSLHKYSDDSATGRLREFNMTMSTAAGVLDTDWGQYYNCDYRSRIYSLSQLSIQGSKPAKSLIRFATGKALGAQGWNRLLAHAADCWGETKLKYHDKISFAEDKLDTWMEIASNPTNDLRWMDADEDKFSFLQAILEIKRAMDSGNEYTYESYIPSGWDAQCSALQFYSALSYDHVGGALCGLIENTFGDYYLAVGEEAFSYKELPKSFKPLFEHRRSLCKRFLMVWLYSCGVENGSYYVYEDNKHEDWMKNVSQEDCLELTKLMVRACKKVLPGAYKLMKFFQSCAKKMVENDKDYGFIAPVTGFNMTQFKRNPIKGQLRLYHNNKEIKPRYIKSYDGEISKKAAIPAAPPQTIHTLDATLMHIFLNKCKVEVLPNHDCIYVRCADADQACEDWRQSFYDLMSKDILKDIAEQCDNMSEYRKLEKGNLNLKGIWKNDWFIS